MTPTDVSDWMLLKLQKEDCIYQDDVVDYIVKSGAEELLKENADGNLVLSQAVLKAFKLATPDNVVWVRSDFYWRWRVTEDEPGRQARG
ncbi:hypothetical protein MSG37_03380 [Shewanella sp. 1CM18E]|uniref:DUF6953 family protein n=1 Tax=Shewanella sp. 1CM18E TaxID=2929169 RepID=UPI0020BD7B1A|nr:hypothetical protein [Shewanella sp. 1CM18E]MCK8043914.1 hypothetical protein [Shewanella sp. 1CM18E]